MKIIQLVPLFTPDGAYGGPTRVAVNQTRELRRRGHEVTLVGGALGYGDVLPTSVDGVPVQMFHARRLFPPMGFAGVVSPRLLRWFHGASKTADIVHLHLARDLITMPAARLALRNDARYVVQAHGMIDESTKMLARPLDALVTRRTLQNALRVYYLTIAERDSLEAVAGRTLRLEHLVNGVPSATDIGTPGSDIEVLFLARLHSRKRPDLFVRAALALAATHPHVRFTLVGPDEGMAQTVTDLIANAPANQRVSWEGALPPERTLNRIAAASIYVLPSVDEPFPMSVLEALSLGKPVVVTDSCGLAPAIATSGAGIVVDSTLESLTAAIDHLLNDATARRRAGTRAKRLADDRFSMTTVVDQLELSYRDLLENTHAGGRTTASPS